MRKKLKGENYMEEKVINTYPKFYTTADVMKILRIGNRACLDLFHRADFPV